jgi:Cft2 family RNA processing exonuclease
MKLEFQYLSQDSLLLKLENVQILLECPDNVVDQKVDWSWVDLILISSHKTGLSLPLITEYSGFKGTVLCTIPTREFLRLCTSENIETRDYSIQDVHDCFLNINGIYYNSPQRLFKNLTITSISSGTGLGSSNWIIQYGSCKVTKM